MSYGMQSLIVLVELCASQAGIKPSASTMLTTVKVLSIKSCFGSNDTKMVPDLLKCFPNVEALHIIVILS